MDLKPAIIALAAGAVLLFAPAGQAAAQKREAAVAWDGTFARFENEAYLDNGAFYLPAREMLEKLGYQVAWDESAGLIVGVKEGGSRLELSPGIADAMLNGRNYTLPLPVQVINGTAFMPAAAVMELLGYQVETDQYKARLYISSSIWQQIDEALAGASAYRLEGVADKSGSSSNASLYLGKELVFTGSWNGGALGSSGKVYDKGRLIYEGGLKANRPEGPGVRYDINGERYEGLFAAGVSQGQGRLYAGNRLLYEGDWKSGRMSGAGKLFDENGKPLFEGLFQNGVRQGYGVLFNPATGKKSYEGNWVGDVRAGYGKAFNNEGKIEYAGYWRKDERNGTGTAHRYGKVNFYGLDGTNVSSVQQVDVAYVTDVEYSSGLLIKQSSSEWVYRGAFTDNGELNGKGEAGRVTGTLISEAGVLNKWTPYFKGDFRYGEMTGSGAFYDEQGALLYEGSIEDGKRQGQGVSYSLGKLQYSGAWDKDLKQGKGWTYSDHAGSSASASFTITESSYNKDVQTGTGNVYRVYGSASDSSTPNAKATGKGAQYLTYDASRAVWLNSGSQSGSRGKLVYEGDLENGLRSGAGIEYLSDGGTYTGSFRNNERNGTGTLVLSSSRYEGEFLNNVKHGQGKLYENGVIVYEGQFRSGLRNGLGVSYRYGGLREYEGDFRDDKRNGTGTLYDYWGTTVVYRGEFKDGLTLAEYNALHP
jgi:hypothetical protein